MLNPTRASALLGAFLLVGACALQDGTPSDDTNMDVDAPLLASGPLVAGAAPNLTIPGHLSAIDEFSALLSSSVRVTKSTVEAQVKRSLRNTGSVAKVASIHEQFGQPTHLWARASTTAIEPAAAAVDYFDRFHSAYNLPPEAAQAASITQVHSTGRGGVIVRFKQSIGGVEVYNTHMNMIMDGDRNLIAITGGLHPAANAHARLPKLDLSAADAIDIAVGDAASGDVSVLTQQVKPVLYPHPKSLELSQMVEFEIVSAGTTSSRAYQYVIANDGRILERVNRTFADAFDYRVYAQPNTPYTPLDGPLEDSTPHPDNDPNTVITDFINSNVISMEGFNTNPDAQADPWLPNNATFALGNNVHAYQDAAGGNGFDNGQDVRLDLSGALEFDYPYNPAQSPSITTDQVRAITTNLFYTTNWLHDYFYDSGFNEAAFVAQNDNFGRGGADGDVMLVEAQDFSGTNNANMSTPSDGFSPRMQMFIWNIAPGADRDSSLDNGIVAHEWGHYFHHRLSICNSGQCRGMSEGWGDFVALHMVIRDGDPLDGTYALAGYSTGNAYYGIRRVPLSIDANRNGMRFRHMGNGEALPTTDPPTRVFGAPNAQSHNTGEIWSATLTEAYFALIADPRHTYAQAKRRMADYMVGGLLGTPVDATFTEVRDSMLAFAAASDPADMLVMAEAFARRGMGTSAVSPVRASTTNDGIVEDFEVGGQIAVADLALEALNDCDGDENWDAGETTTLKIMLTNNGPATLPGSTITISADQTFVSFPNGSSITSEELLGYQTEEIEVEVLLAGSLLTMETINFAVMAENSESLITTAEGSFSRMANFDNLPATSATDDAESSLVVWLPESTVPAFEWNRVAENAPNTQWHADGAGSLADQTLQSPPLEVGAADFTVTFDHAYDFEADFDGGVIELSDDNGATWTDIGVDAGYGDTPLADGGNPIGGRRALNGQSAGYPAKVSATLNLGTTYSNLTVLVRFRVGTDQAVGAEGWDIDNLAFGGINNTPFATVGADETVCEPDPDPDPDPDPNPDPNPGPEDGGCGCQSSTSGNGLGFLLLIGLALVGLGRKRRK